MQKDTLSIKIDKGLRLQIEAFALQSGFLRGSEPNITAAVLHMVRRQLEAFNPRDLATKGYVDSKLRELKLQLEG